MIIRPITLKDYPKLIPFWKLNYFVNEMDCLERFQLFLEKNPELCFLAEKDGKIAGTVLGSYDGRRGYIQKLVVDKALYKQGIGKKLLDMAVKKLRSIGATYIPISCEIGNVLFFEKAGFQKTTQTAMNISFSDNAWKKYVESKK